jgi:hypothetical protein
MAIGLVSLRHQMGPSRTTNQTSFGPIWLSNRSLFRLTNQSCPFSFQRYPQDYMNICFVPPNRTVVYFVYYVLTFSGRVCTCGLENNGKIVGGNTTGVSLPKISRIQSLWIRCAGQGRVRGDVIFGLEVALQDVPGPKSLLCYPIIKHSATCPPQPQPQLIGSWKFFLIQLNV